MKIDHVLIENQIDKSFKKGSLMVKDQRNNKIFIKNGDFSVNGVEQPKSKDSIKSILLEAFKLSREVQIENDTYIRSNSKWVQKIKV